MASSFNDRDVFGLSVAVANLGARVKELEGAVEQWATRALAAEEALNASTEDVESAESSNLHPDPNVRHIASVVKESE